MNEIEVGEVIVDEEILVGEMELDVIKQYPELENLEVTPSAEEQVFKSEKYGFDEVKVNAVPSEELTITPSANEQIKEGMFNKVTVEGDEDLKPENILSGKTIFGVKGNVEADPELTRSFMALMDDSLGFNISKFPDGITKIPKYCCEDRKNLTYLEFPSTVKEIAEYAFNRTTNLLKVVLNEGLVSIGGYAFQNSGVKEINLPSTVISIGGYSLSRIKVVSLTIPENVTELPYNMLDQCSNLETVIIKSRKLTINNNTFFYDQKLTKVIFENLTSVPTLVSTNSFLYTPIAKYNNKIGYIYVPDVLVEDFKSATNWSTYADQIKPLSELEVA